MAIWFIVWPFGLLYIWPFGTICGHFGMSCQEIDGNPARHKDCERIDQIAAILCILVFHFKIIAPRRNCN
jgi:hypothetical protein